MKRYNINNFRADLEWIFDREKRLEYFCLLGPIEAFDAVNLPTEYLMSRGFDRLSQELGTDIGYIERIAKQLASSIDDWRLFSRTSVEIWDFVPPIA